MVLDLLVADPLPVAVQMVHNGIEYGDMQLIAEIYDILKHAAGLTNDELAQVMSLHLPFIPP